MSAERRAEAALRRGLRAADERTGSAPILTKLIRYVFPDHWSFLLGEIALYSFIFLIASGTFLALFYEPSLAETVYRGDYAPLDGRMVSEAYASTLRLSFDVPAGLLFRQAHHWAALVFLAAIVCHLLRIFFTGAFRKPRELNYLIGVTLLVLALVEGFAGYSLPDDLLSGMGLQIANGVALSIPVVGGDLAVLVWNGQFPGADDFQSRLYIAHVFIVPALMGGLIVGHLLGIALPRHTQFRGARQQEGNVVGTPLWPGYMLRSIGLLLASIAVLIGLGGLFQINPIWQWGPFEPFQATNGAQPDWYMGWLIGALRLMPEFEPVIGGYTLAGNPFFGGVLLPSLVFALLYAWPAVERRVSCDRRAHHLLDRPRDAAWRTSVGVSVLTFLLLIFLAGSADRIFVSFGIDYTAQVWIFRGLVILLPPLAYLASRRVCRELSASGWRPLGAGRVLTADRRSHGGFESGAELNAPDAARAGGDRTAGPSPDRGAG